MTTIEKNTQSPALKDLPGLLLGGRVPESFLLQNYDLPCIIISDNRQGEGYMGGSIHPYRKNWCISIYFEKKRYIIPKHPITREPFYSKRAAEKQLDKIRCEIDDGTFNPKAWLPDSPLSTRIYCEDWLNIIDVQPKTLYHLYRPGVKYHIVPFFEDKDIRKIRYNDIVKFKNYLFEKDLSEKSVYNYVNVLKKIMHDAWRNEDIESVPPFPSLSSTLPEIKYLTPEQQSIMIGAIPERDRAIFIIGMELGLRNEELRALQKDCLHEYKNRKGETVIEITIRQVFTYDKGGDVVRETTKTGDKGKRILPLTSFARNVLKSIPPHISPFVFVRRNGMPYRNKDLNKIWHKAEKATGIKCRLQNALRHSLGCQLLDMGYDEGLVGQIYGHTNPKITKRYAKRSQITVAEALEKRAKIVRFRGKREN